MTITADQQDLKSCCGEARRQRILSSFLNTSYISFPYRKKQKTVFPVIQQVSCYSEPQHHSTGGEEIYLQMGTVATILIITSK